jgi:hypothetical protein
MDRVLGSHHFWAVVIVNNCNRSTNKSNHPIQNPLLVTESRKRENILSRARVPWLLLQFRSIIKTHNRWLPKTRSIPYWTTKAFSSTVTGLVLIYESVTSSVSVVRCLTLHSWTLSRDCILTELWVLLSIATALNDDRFTKEMVHESSTTDSIKCVSFHNSGRIRERPPPRTVRLLLRLLIFKGTWLPNRCLAMDYSASIRCCENVC